MKKISIKISIMVVNVLSAFGDQEDVFFVFAEPMSIDVVQKSSAYGHMKRYCSLYIFLSS